MALTQVNPALFAGSSNTVTTIQSNGTTAITIDSSQNVGIGTTSPGTNLQINSASGGAIRLQYIGNSGYGQVETNANNELIFKTGGANERMRIDSSGNVLINTTSALGSFTNFNKSALLSTDSVATTNGQYSITNITSASNNATVTALRLLSAAGTVIGTSGIAGTVFVRVRGGSGADQYTASYTLNSGGNGTTDAAITIIGVAKVRGTNPVSSIQLANDGAGGGVAVTVTYINNSGVVNSGQATLAFIGVLV